MIPLALVSRVVAILVDVVSVSTRPLDGPWPDPSSRAKNRSAPPQRPNFFYPTFDVKRPNYTIPLMKHSGAICMALQHQGRRKTLA